MRTYKGFSWDFEGVAQELFRVTKLGGAVVWNVSDATIKGSETGTSFRQALYFMECGFNLHDTMIWVKDGGGCIGSHYTYNQNFEYMFVFTKGKPKTVHIIKDKPNGSFGKVKGKGSRTANGAWTPTGEKYTVTDEYSRRNNWWYVPVGVNTTGHPAVFPESIPNDHIISWSNEGDVILDPFMGSGTTAKMAMINNRKFVGFELSGEYCDIIKNRLESINNT